MSEMRRRAARVLCAERPTDHPLPEVPEVRLQRKNGGKLRENAVMRKSEWSQLPGVCKDRFGVAVGFNFLLAFRAGAVKAVVRLRRNAAARQRYAAGRTAWVAGQIEVNALEIATAFFCLLLCRQSFPIRFKATLRGFLAVAFFAFLFLSAFIPFGGFCGEPGCQIGVSGGAEFKADPDAAEKAEKENKKGSGEISTQEIQYLSRHDFVSIVLGAGGFFFGLVIGRGIAVVFFGILRHRLESRCFGKR